MSVRPHERNDLADVMASAAEGTTTSVPALADQFDIPEYQIEELLAERGIEACDGCGWWFRDHGGPGDDLLCEDCTDHHGRD